MVKDLWSTDSHSRETLINVRTRARVAFACEQGAVTAVPSFCTREPQPFRDGVGPRQPTDFIYLYRATPLSRGLSAPFRRQNR
ncbi:hypothetical protein B0684_04045 [Thioalkalivibrio versutus]|nr:hypothetical protein B0684_04045 [Thioalkalivibrio versutus]